ncbi:4Fe-4S binding protein [Bacillus sp. JJ1764]|uniref:4Fe-4S binding protein n=1 Tax=Bacillus sp. JJ1764 TaxID=3122964 RepID=UPI002FFF12C2
MSLILDWLESMHIDFELTDRCSKVRNNHSTCSYCMNACQLHALVIQDKKMTLNKDLCTFCGECMISCPLSAITGIASERQFLDRSIIHNDSFTPSVKELLIYKKRGIQSISLETTHQNKWHDVIKEANILLKQLGQTPFEVVVKRDSKTTRRELLQSLKSEGRKIAKIAAPAAWKIKDGEWVLTKYYPGNQFYTVQLNKEKCTLCQACFTLCSQNVFQIKENILCIMSNRCVNCTDCTDICPENALEIYFECSEYVEVTEEFLINICQSCGKTFKTFHSRAKECPICLNRDPEWLSPYG